MLKIEIEGCDGSGKSTALKYFVEQARKKGLIVVETREVGNPHIPSCVKMREFVLDPANNMRGETMELIFTAMRFENDLWLENLSKSENPPFMVVSDRGWFSHLSYTDHNVSTSFTEKFYENFVSVNTSMPDVVIYFSVDTNTALKRRVKRGTAMDVIEMKGVEYQEKVKESFEYHLNEYIDRISIFEVDANQDIENVQRQMDEILNTISK